MNLDDPKMLIADADDTDHCTRVIIFVDDTYFDVNDNLHDNDNDNLYDNDNDNLNDNDNTDHCTRVISHSCWLVWRVLVLRDSGPIHLVWTNKC